MENRKLRILYIAHERKLGGATLCLLTLIDAMKAKGHSIFVVVPTAKCPLALELERRNVPFVAVFFAWTQMPSYWNRIAKLCFRFLYLLEPLQVNFVYQIMKKKGIDIVHSNSSVTDFGARLAEKLRCKHIWHIREFGDADYNFEYLKGKAQTWRWMNAHTDLFVFISKCVADYFKTHADPEKSQVIYDGISEDYIIDKDYSEKEKITFLISGNLTRGKGQMLVLQAAKELKEKGYIFQVWIAGCASSMTDSKEYEKELKSYIEVNLPDVAAMLGRVSDMNNLRRQADVEIVASNKEAFGRVTVEAMLGGMPVIASDTGASPELIKDGVDGFLFANGDFRSLAEKMSMFLDNRADLKAMGMQARINALKQFMADTNVEKVEQLYYEQI